MSPEEYAAIQNTIDKLTKEKEQNEKEHIKSMKNCKHSLKL